MAEPKKTVEFQNKKYSEAALEKMSEADLLTLRNLVASNLGVASIKSFRDTEQAREATWKALLKFDETGDEDLASDKKVKAEKKPKEPAAPKEPRNVKGAEAQVVKRPTKNMFRKIQKLVDMPNRVKERWANYKDGMTVLETIEGPNMTPLDVYWYVSQGFMKLIEPTTEEVTAGIDSWYKKHGLENPNAAKQKRDEQRAKDKAEKDKKKAEEAAAKQALKDKKKAEEAAAKKPAESSAAA